MEFLNILMNSRNLGDHHRGRLHPSLGSRWFSFRFTEAAGIIPIIDLVPRDVAIASVFILPEMDGSVFEREMKDKTIGQSSG
jgi:hypothetical protein